MCLGGGGSTKVKVPEPSPLPPPLPPPPPPKPPAAPPKPLQPTDAKPDIRIGAAKKQTNNRNRTTQRGSGSQSLTIGNNQGLNL